MLVSARSDPLTYSPLARGVLSALMSFSGHADFVAKELEKMHDSDVTEAGSDREHATPSVDPSESAERDELGRVAQAVCG